MYLNIKNEKLSQVTRTDDGVRAFEVAADNGQLRLAVDILNDLLPSIVDKIEEIEQKINSLISDKTSAKPTVGSKVKEDKNQDSSDEKQ